MARRKVQGTARLNQSSASAILWAPWRAPYVLGKTGRAKRCIFCFDGLSAAQRRHRLILYCGRHTAVILNRYPYNNGHLLVAPRRHAGSTEALSHLERSALFETLAESTAILRRAMKPEGFNVGANFGRIAGAGIADHLHWHVVPRWSGDNNFMPVLASTRVLSQHLEAGFALLEPFFRNVRVPIS